MQQLPTQPSVGVQLKNIMALKQSVKENLFIWFAVVLCHQPQSVFNKTLRSADCFLFMDHKTTSSKRATCELCICFIYICIWLLYFRYSSCCITHLMERRLSGFAERHHVSLSRDALALCWAPSLLQQPCTVSATLATSARFAVQLSHATFKHSHRDAVPGPHGVSHRSHRVWAHQTARAGRGGGGKMSYSQFYRMTK